MHDAEGLKFKIVTMGQEQVDRRQPSNLRPITLPKLLAWIENQISDLKLQAELKKAAAAYPQQALWSFKQNFAKHVSRLQKKLKNNKSEEEVPIKELGEDESSSKDQS